MKRKFAVAIALPALVAVTSGCATRDWVRQALGKRDAEVDQRFVAVDQRVGEETGRIDRRLTDMDRRTSEQFEGVTARVGKVESGLADASTLAGGARERADAAFARADGAFARADAVDQRLTRLWSNRHQRNLVEAVNVHFGFDRWDLDDKAQTALAALVKELKQNPRLTVDLEGFADPKGTYNYNVALSQRRVEAVRRYLVEKGIELPRIHSVGLGPIMDGGLTDAQKRRVTVKLMVQAD